MLGLGLKNHHPSPNILPLWERGNNSSVSTALTRMASLIEQCAITDRSRSTGKGGKGITSST